MPLLSALGYLRGSLHTGLVAILVEHSNEEKAPIQTMLTSLGVHWTPDAGDLEYQYEFKRIDLAIWAGGNPLVAIEMKTDDCESPGWQPTQTGRLANDPNLGLFQLLFVTLGDGEYSGPPVSNDFTHIPLARWCDAVRGARDCTRSQFLIDILTDYMEEYEAELEMRHSVAGLSNFNFQLGNLHPRIQCNPPRRAPERRTPYMSVLSQVRMRWLDDYANEPSPRLFIHGAGKDTILHFGDLQGRFSDREAGLYFEINRNGKLNAKTSRSERDNNELFTVAKDLFGECVVKRIRGQHNESVTLAQFDVGLLAAQPDEDDPIGAVVRRIAEVVGCDA